MTITSIWEVLVHFDIDDEGVDNEENYSALKRAIAKGRIGIVDNLLCLSLSQPAKFFRSDAGCDDCVVQFRAARGGDHRILLNSGGKKVGDALFKIICRLSGITDKSIEEQPIGDVKIMEDIVNLFL